MEQKRERVERLGYFSISIAGVIAVSLVLGIVGYYKMVLFGPYVLLWSAVGALIGFVLLAAAFLGYSKFFLTATRGERITESAEAALPSARTNPLIADKPIDYIPSVTEDSTELLDPVSHKERD